MILLSFDDKMKLALLLSVLLIHSARCQRRGPWRGARPPPRRLPPCIEERLRSASQGSANYRTPEIPPLNRLTETPVASGKIEAPSTLETAAQLAQSIPKPVPIPATDFYQNVLLSPKLFSIVPNQFAPNRIVPTLPNQLVQTEIPVSYQVPMQNVQYFENLLIPKPQERVISEAPVVEVPRPEKIFVQAVEPEISCPCKVPSPTRNSFLPAASPLSPWLAPNLLSAPTQSRSHFLRKIPIPPPTL